jgi:pyridoxine kinase
LVDDWERKSKSKTLGVRRSPFGVRRSAFGVRRLAFGVLAFGVRRTQSGQRRPQNLTSPSARQIFTQNSTFVIPATIVTAERRTVNGRLSHRMTILSIQSSVAYGHVGNSAAVFPLQRIGVEVWPVHTVHFSNHTGYGAWRGMVLSAETVAEVIQGIEERGVLHECDGVLSGYLGDASLGEVILDAFNRVKRANPSAVYCCDPVMGDVERGFFVRPGIPEFMRDRAVPAATIITPNQFELEYLADRAVTDLESALASVDQVMACGPSVVLVTSLRRRDARGDQIEMLAVDSGGAFTIETPLLPVNVNGAGDMTAALFFAHWRKSGSIQIALELTTGAVFAVLEATVAAGAREIQLIKAQESIANPSRRFQAARVR